MTAAIFIAALILLSTTMASANYAQRYDREEVPSVRLFEHRNFSGGVLSMANVIGCTNFDHTYFNDRVSSIDTRGHCFYLYEDARCQGRHVRLASDTNGHSDLNVLTFNDVASSLRAC